jgi:hypothetical protein
MEEIVLDFILVTTYFILGSVGNIAIIWLYSKMNQRRTKAYKEIIVFLAIVDLISCILNSFLNIALLIGPRFLENSYFFKFLRFSCHVTTVYSAFILLVIALQRYLLICRPNVTSQNSTWWRNCKLVVTSCSIKNKNRRTECSWENCTKYDAYFSYTRCHLLIKRPAD